MSTFPTAEFLIANGYTLEDVLALKPAQPIKPIKPIEPDTNNIYIILEFARSLEQWVDQMENYLAEVERIEDLNYSHCLVVQEFIKLECDFYKIVPEQNQTKLWKMVCTGSHVNDWFKVKEHLIDILESAR